MGASLAYKHTDADLDEIREILGIVRDCLAELGIGSYCLLLDDELDPNQTPPQFMAHAFEKINGRKLLFVVLMSSEKSEGMLMEVGYAIAKGIPVIVAVRNGVENTYLPEMACLAIPWTTAPALESALKKEDIQVAIRKAVG